MDIPQRCDDGVGLGGPGFTLICTAVDIIPFRPRGEDLRFLQGCLLHEHKAVAGLGVDGGLAALTTRSSSFPCGASLLFIVKADAAVLSSLMALYFRTRTSCMTTVSAAAEMFQTKHKISSGCNHTQALGVDPATQGQGYPRVPSRESRLLLLCFRGQEVDASSSELPSLLVVLVRARRKATAVKPYHERRPSHAPVDETHLCGMFLSL